VATTEPISAKRSGSKIIGRTKESEEASHREESGRDATILLFQLLDGLNFNAKDLLG